MITGIAYPQMAPPLDWLKIQFLFYDEIKSIVPETEISELPTNHKKFYDQISGSMSFIHPENETLWASQKELIRLEKGFKLISEKVQFNPNEAIFTISDSIQIEGCTHLHVNKTTPDLLQILEKCELLPSGSREVASGLALSENFLVVETNAANLILGHLANDLSRKYGFSPITYQNDAFIINSLNDLDVSHKIDSKTLLTTAILKLELPYEISTMKIQDYLSLRDAYSDIREPFHLMINNLSDLHRLDTIENTEKLRERVKNIVTTFDQDYMKFKKSKLARKIQKWVPFGGYSVLTLLSILTLPSPFNIVIPGVSVLLVTIDKVVSGRKEPANSTIFNRLSRIENEIITKADIKPLI